EGLSNQDLIASPFAPSGRRDLGMRGKDLSVNQVIYFSGFGIVLKPGSANPGSANPGSANKVKLSMGSAASMLSCQYQTSNAKLPMPSCQCQNEEWSGDLGRKT
ncbi:MAG: hypothetical protein MUF72_19765, partial [Elainella sp. Prado103]|nr:hypothetical protein [Elainella sp. Prado103]